MKNMFKKCLLLLLALCMLGTFVACTDAETTTSGNVTDPGNNDNNGNNGNNGPDIPNDEKPNGGGGNKDDGPVDPLPEGDDKSDPGLDDIF